MGSIFIPVETHGRRRTAVDARPCVSTRLCVKKQTAHLPTILLFIPPIFKFNEYKGL
ncbi:MAG: hypothetical protein VSS75_018375 [Candidatus Parabeggiatoa sp.]|nr:hypothetical protein [Candidatus Parabeggiatoa sp.]